MALKFASSSEWLITNVAIPAHFFCSTGLEEWHYFEPDIVVRHESGRNIGHQWS